MSYKIIGDSCTDLTKELQELRKEGKIALVPLTLSIGEEQFIDDDTFNQKEFIAKMASSSECPKSACPSPERFMREFDDSDECYVITLSGQLSGSYNSAELAKNMYLEDYPDKKIEVIDSCSASVCQTLIAMKIIELKEQGNSFEEVREKIYKFREGLHTKFVIDSLETFRKNGRLNNLTAAICNVLNIKPVMGGSPEGQIIKLGQARGMTKALLHMVELMESDAQDVTMRTLGIAHCNNKERAEYVKHEILKKIPFKNCIIVDMAGVSTLYANDGGIIVAY